MKQKYLFLCLVLSYSSFCQLPICDYIETIKTRAYSGVKPLDKTQIPGGTLYDLVLPMAELSRFNGSASTDTSNYEHFLQAWHEVYESSFNTAGLKHFSKLETDIDAFHINKKFHHPIGFIDFLYGRLKDNALASNLVYVANQKLYDTPGRNSSPYETKTAALASVLTTEDLPCLYPGIHYLYFKNSFVLSNTSFDLNNVSFLQIKLNNVPVYNQSVSGINELSIPVTIPNVSGSTTIEISLTIAGTIKKYLIQTCKLGQEPYNECKGYDFLEIEGYQYDGGYGKGLHREYGIAHIYYSGTSCATKAIKRPIIFVDGFDAGNKQHYEEIWAKYLNAPFLEGNITKNLGTELLAAGYDIIILDQVKTQPYNSGGAGQIENNGLVLAKLLDVLYTNYSGTITDEAIVVGASMGGLVARFGLAWMETNYKPHHTKLFVSFDCPQNGASIPIGLQQMLDNFTQNGILAASQSVRNSAHYSIAAKQMLLNHSSSNSETTQAHPFRAQFLSNLAAVGNWPQNLRKVAINNGNNAGFKKSVTGNPPEIPNIAAKDKYLDIGMRRLGTPGCNLSLCYLWESRLFAQSEVGRYKTQEFYVNSVTNLWNFISPSLPVIGNTKYAYPETGFSYDVAPGSRLRQDPIAKNLPPNFDAYWSIGNAILAGGLGTTLITSTNNLKWMNFMPSISSSAYTFPNNEARNLYKNFIGVPMTRCEGTTPFDAVYAYSDDMLHVDINLNIANAFKSEVYYPKAKLTCPGGCPDNITALNNVLATPSELIAKKTVNLLPGFAVNTGKVFKAQIGCGNTPTVLNIASPDFNPTGILSNCALDWDLPNTEVTCGTGFTKFTLFVKNLEAFEMAEFSTNGLAWTTANFGNNALNITLNENGQTAQTFYARIVGNSGSQIIISRNYCP
jgi:hypothetical protein